MNALFVGDIHNHTQMLDDVEQLDKQYNFDKIVFLGDYIDDWNTTNLQSIETLYRVIKLKLSNTDKYVLLLGNHELSYLGKPCSGHKDYLSEIVELILKNYIRLFNLHYTIQLQNNEFVCTHAGITNKYILNYLNGNGNWKLGMERLESNILDNIDILSLCSYFRGGKDDCSSFLWTDYREHEYYNSDTKPLIPNQIIGHTPVKTIQDIKTNDYHYIFIDTHSTYRDGSSYGDNSYLMWNNNKFKSIVGGSYDVKDTTIQK